MKDFPAAIEKIEQAQKIFAKIGNKLRLAKSQILLVKFTLKQDNGMKVKHLPLKPWI